MLFFFSVQTVILWWFSLAGTLVTCLICIATGTLMHPPCYLSRAVIILCGFLSLAGQLLKTFGARYVSMPVVSLLFASEIAMLFVAQTVLFHKVPNHLSLLGTAVIMVALTFLISRAFIIA